MTLADLLAGLAILVGLVGIVVPVLPGGLLILIAVLVWAAAVGTATAWAAAGVATVFLVVGAVVKYTIPGRRLKAVGVPTSTIVAGGLLGIVGFFVIPGVGLFAGFVLGVYVAELRRVGAVERLALYLGGAQGQRPLDPDRARVRAARCHSLPRRRGGHLMAVLLATLAAVAYGLSDFVGGLVSRRTSAWAVAFVAQIASTSCVAVVAVFRGGDPTGADFGWAALAGVGTGLGTGFLYRGLATGRMGVVAPVSAVGAAVVPVVVGAATGERPSSLVWLGVFAALPGIWLVSSQPPSEEPTGSVSEGLVDGVLAGLGFGLLFAALGQVPDTAGMWPLAFCQAVSAVAVAGLAVALGADWVPRERVALWGLFAGPLGAAAAVLFLLATQRGLLTVSGVIASLYPAATVLLAATVLRERIHAVQAAGLVLCAAAITLVAAG